MAELILPTSFEEMRNAFEASKADQKLMEFIEPLDEVETEINEIASELGKAGKVVFLLGNPGTGKSTFIQSLSWRPHIKIRCLKEINANEYNTTGSMRELYNAISLTTQEASRKIDGGPTCIVINYLENLENFEKADIKAFYRDLNGLLRTSPLFIIWPVTSEEDVSQMMEYARTVSSTIFPRNKEIIRFNGPHEEKFIDITKRSIAVINDGMELSDFSLTDKDLEETFCEFKKLPKIQKNIREYLEMVKERWRKVSGHQAKIRAEIPKSTEVWFLFSYRDAESIVGQFARKSQRIEDSWSAIHDKFYEYIPNSQRSAKWDAKRLQLALYGAIKTRIMFLPTNALISCISAYSTNPQLNTLINNNNVPANWKDKKEAKRSLSNTPLYKQLINEPYPAGKRKGGPAASALDTASPIFAAIVQWISGQGGSDVEINRSVAEAISDIGQVKAVSNQAHPWIKNIIPDIFIELPHKQICIEFHFTNRDAPGVIADYVLGKLDVYMDQLEMLIKSPKA